MFVVRRGRVVTPPLTAGILDGLTREFVLSLCRGANIPAEEADVAPEELFSADEIFLTSTTRELAPIVRIDGRQAGSGRPGPMTLRLLSIFREAAMEASNSHEDR